MKIVMKTGILCLVHILAVASHAEVFNKIVIGEDPPTLDYQYEYESIGVLSSNLNLRFHSPNSIFFHTGSNLTPKMTIKATGSVEIRGDLEAPRILAASAVNGQVRFATVRDGVTGWSFGQDVNDAHKFKLANDWMNLNANTALTVERAGNVGIGTMSPTHKLTVNGPIRAKEIIVDTGWADDVFSPDYNLTSLREVETHIEQEGRLPGMPSAKEVAEKGISLGEAQSLLLRKIEELTLHVIRQQKEIDELRSKP